MSVIVNICGILVATANFPDQTLQDFYQQYYHCKIERRYDDSLTDPRQNNGHIVPLKIT